MHSGTRPCRKVPGTRAPTRSVGLCAVAAEFTARGACLLLWETAMAKAKTAKKTNDDLFEGTTMTFGEHLEELRVCLFRSVIGIALGCVIGFMIANNVVNFFQTPLTRAMERYYIDKAITDY